MLPWRAGLRAHHLVVHARSSAVVQTQRRATRRRRISEEPGGWSRWVEDQGSNAFRTRGITCAGMTETEDPNKPVLEAHTCGGTVALFDREATLGVATVARACQMASTSSSKAARRRSPAG